MIAVIHINMDNAAFQDYDNPAHELARILEKLSRSVSDNLYLSDGYSIPLFDINGNDVGYLGISR